VFHNLVGQQVQFHMLGKPFLFMFMLTGAMAAAAFLASHLLRLSPDDRVSLILSASMINIGNFGLPLVLFTYGEPAVSLTLVIQFTG
jgi:predicted permease